MSQNNAVFKCPVCESLVEALEMYGPELTCCGRVMELQREQTGGLSREHHAPIVRRCGDEVCVHVGSVPHAMTERHHIQWIEVLSGGRVQRQYLQAGDEPEATFHVASDRVTVRAMCSLHGLWKRSLPAFLPEYMDDREPQELRAS